MNCIEISTPGGPDVLKLASRPTPVPGDGEVLIRVAAAGVNRPDVFQRIGHYPPPPGASDIPGLEVAGVIEQVGGAGTATGTGTGGGPAWQVGDRVCALVSGGGYAEYCVAPAGQCLPVPAGLDMTQAAALPETVFTVWTNVFERGRLRAGETLLVHGGTSGIGTTAIQLAHARGARVFATAGSAEKCEACRQLGAELAINYRDSDFVQAVMAATDGRGVDVILDMVGGDYLTRNIAALAFEGRLVQIATLQGGKATLDLRPILQRRLTITGSTLRARSVAEKTALATAVRHHVWPLIESGRLHPVIHATWPLAQAAEAHRTMEGGQHIGKLVLLVQS